MVAESALSPSQGLWIWLHQWQTGIGGQKVRLIDLPIPIRSSDIDSIFRLFRSIQLVDVRFQFLYQSIVLVYFKFQSFHRPILFLGFKFRFLYRVISLGKTFYLEIFVALSKEFSDWSRFYRFIGVGKSIHFWVSLPIFANRRWTWTGDFKCREVKTGFCRKRWTQTGSSGTLIGWKSGQTTFIPLWDRMEGAWLWTGRGKLRTRDNLLMGEGTGVEPNHTTSIRPQENFVLYKSFNLA